MLAVLGALFANGLITILKFAAALMTGSSGMMAESLHSFAGTTNLASIVIGLVLAVVAFVLARTSRGLLLGEAANKKCVVAIKQAIRRPPKCSKGRGTADNAPGAETDFDQCARQFA